MKILAFLLGLSLSASALALTPMKLALNWKPEPQFGGFYAASLAKEDERQGLKFEILEGGSGTPTVQMLANGQVDLAIVSAEEILISNERNPKNPVIGVFAVYQTNPQMIMCHAEKGFKTLKDVFQSGSTIALQNGLTYAQFLKKKYPSAKAKFVPYLGGLTNYLADKNFCQQGFITSEPLAAENARQPAKAFLIADEGFNPYTTVVAVRAETLRKDEATIRKAVAAIRTGWQGYLADPAATNKRMGELNKAMDALTFAKSAAAQIPLIETEETKKGRLGEMSLSRWSSLGQQLKELGVLKKVPLVTDAYRNL